MRKLQFIALNTQPTNAFSHCRQYHRLQYVHCKTYSKGNSISGASFIATHSPFDADTCSIWDWRAHTIYTTSWNENTCIAADRRGEARCPDQCQKSVQVELPQRILLLI